MSYQLFGVIWLAVIIIGVILWRKTRYKFLVAWSKAVFNNIEQINKIKDRWMETRIKIYADGVKIRYPHGLKWWEKIFAPLIMRKYFGTVANLISVIRSLLAIIIGLLLIIHYYLIWYLALVAIITSLLIFIVASLLDLLDGPTARAMHEISNLGKILDPLADKILFASVFIPIGYAYLPSMIYWIIIGQESFLIFITLLKISAKRLPFVMASQANMFGKVKNIFELVGGGMLFLCLFSRSISIVADVLFIISMPLAIGSIIGYLSSIKKNVPETI